MGGMDFASMLKGMGGGANFGAEGEDEHDHDHDHEHGEDSDDDLPDLDAAPEAADAKKESNVD